MRIYIHMPIKYMCNAHKYTYRYHNKILHLYALCTYAYMCVCIAYTYVCVHVLRIYIYTHNITYYNYREYTYRY